MYIAPFCRTSVHQPQSACAIAITLRADFHWGNGTINDDDPSSGPNSVVEIDDVAGFHADAAVADRAADVALFRGAVDVDVAAEGVLVLGLGAAEPEDAGDDGVATGGVRWEDFAGGFAAFEDGAGGFPVADFLGDFHGADGRFVAAGSIAEAEFGGGDAVTRDREALIAQFEPLLRDADVEDVIPVFDTATEKGDGEEEGDEAE